ncbi:hypothetical protein H4F49_09855 [Pectobacterium polaris]|nr:hypothetical protein [Pectobacterium polaris]MBN3080944.1 hypothetical protein [Pectobacterium polaris]
MNIIDFPSTIYVGIGTLLASLIAGVFSYLNLIASKENKVSEFRLNWIDGLRNEIAELTSGVQNISLITTYWDDHSNLDDNPELQIKWLSELLASRKIAIESMTKIRLRLNYKAINGGYSNDEKTLIEEIEKARKTLEENNFDEVIKSMDKIRIYSAPILKSSWETVKKGEEKYIRIKKVTSISLIFIFLSMLASVFYLFATNSNENKYKSECSISVTECLKIKTDSIKE